MKSNLPKGLLLMKKDTTILKIDINANNAGFVNDRNIYLRILYISWKKAKQRTKYLVLKNKLNYESLLKVCEKL